MEALIAATESFVREYMSQYDSSHDYQHILRVLHLSKYIEAKERTLRPDVHYDTHVITLASLLHDVGDKKYSKEGDDAATMVERFLTSHGADEELARAVQQIATNVSYSAEIKDPAEVQKALRDYPELAVVQDADRLDALGAVGIGRCFTFEGAKRREEGMNGAIDHFGEKLERLEDMMKTDTGRKLAAVRTQRLKTFKGWWEDEVKGLDHMSSD
jgi:uncharacterized protein